MGVSFRKTAQPVAVCPLTSGVLLLVLPPKLASHSAKVTGENLFMVWITYTVSICNVNVKHFQRAFVTTTSKNHPKRESKRSLYF